MSWQIMAALGAAITLVSVFWLLRPWWSRAPAAGLRRRQVNVAGYRQRQAELADEVATGLLSVEAAEALRRELDARLLADTRGDAHIGAGGMVEAVPERAASRWFALLLVIVVAAGVGGYYAQGSWHTQSLIARAEEDPAGAQQVAIEEMVSGLADRLRESPEDQDGWAMLGRSLFVLQRYEESAAAWNYLNNLVEHENPDFLVEEGEARALANQSDLRGRPQALFEQALALAPTHPKALWYAGIAAVRAGDNQKAAEYWTALSRQSLPDEFRAVLTQQIAMLNVELPEPTTTTTTSTSTSTSMTTSAAAAPGDVALVSLRLQVRVAPALAAEIPADATLFVFARAAEGPAMPLAVYRGLASELPREVVLDDTAAMSPQFKLSLFDNWRVTARISRSGQAQAQPGDLQGELRLSRAESGQEIELLIDQRVE